MKKFGNQWKWAHNYATFDRGRIWLAWNSASVALQIMQKSTQVIHCHVGDSFSILINCIPCKPFHAQKYPRQGDRMSPFLSALAMEYLSKCLGHLKSTPEFNFHPRCERLSITHLMFANDFLMFAIVDLSSLQLMFDAFNKFSKAS